MGKLPIEASAIGLAFFLAYILAEIVKPLVAKIFNNKHHPNFDIEDKRRLYTLYEQHQVRDSDGTPLWYVPRNYEKSLEKIADCLQVLTVTQKETLKLLEKIENRLEGN